MFFSGRVDYNIAGTGFYWYVLRGDKFMKMRYCDNSLDNMLFEAFFQEHIDEEVIRDLVRQGANVNAVDDTDESLLYHASLNVKADSEKDIKTNSIPVISGRRHTLCERIRL